MRARARTCSSRCTGRRSSTARCSPRRSRPSTRSRARCRSSSRSTRARARCSAPPAAGAVTLTDPVGYLDFLSLEADAAAVLTDSGGIQEETTYLGIPCFTLRDNTERPVTVRAGTNTLLGLAPERIAEIPGAARGGSERSAPQPPEKWDGHAALRRRRSAGGLVASRRCRCRRWSRRTESSSTSSARRGRTPFALRGCSRTCSRTGRIAATSRRRSCSPSRRATGSPTP